MSQLNSRIEDGQVSEVQLQKKIKELQVWWEEAVFRVQESYISLKCDVLGNLHGPGASPLWESEEKSRH